MKQAKHTHRNPHYPSSGDSHHPALARTQQGTSFAKRKTQTSCNETVEVKTLVDAESQEAVSKAIRLRGGCSGSDDGGDWELCEQQELEAELRRLAKERYKLVRRLAQFSSQQRHEMGGSPSDSQRDPDSRETSHGDERMMKSEDTPFAGRTEKAVVHIGLQPHDMSARSETEEKYPPRDEARKRKGPDLPV